MSIFTLLVGAMAGLVSCATDSQTNRQPQVTNGIVEYRELAAEAEAAVLEAVDWLDRLGAKRNGVPAKLMTGFSQKVDELQVESMLVRARAQAIQGRGDAWFESWFDQTTSFDEERRSQLAKRVPELQQHFTRVKGSSQAAREAFDPFFSGLRRLRVELTANPGALTGKEMMEFLQTTRAHGVEVVKQLHAVRDELQALEAVVALAKSEASL